MTTPADELRTAAADMRTQGQQGAAEDWEPQIPAAAALALAHLLDLEETYLVGMPENESLAHVRAALAVARAINGSEQR